MLPASQVLTKKMLKIQIRGRDNLVIEALEAASDLDMKVAISDAIAERVRKIGGTTVRSIGHVAKLQRIADNDADYVDPEDMLAEFTRKQSCSRCQHAGGARLCEEAQD